MTRSSSAVIRFAVGIALLTAGLLQAAPAAASHVQCGDVITQSTTLDSDLVNCPGDGVVIGADNITLDLNGHVIDGASTQSPNGVDNTAGHDNVTVENGTIQEFRSGVEFEHADAGLVSDVSIHDVFGGVRLFFSNGNEVDRNEFARAPVAIFIGDLANGNRIARNSVQASGDAVFLGPLSTIITPQMNLIEKNSFSNNQYGIYGWAIRTDIEQNSITSSAQSGIQFIINSIGNTLVDNYIAENGYGILVGGGGTRDTTLLRNRVLNSAEDGIQVNSNVRGTVVERNVANGNGDDGIGVDTDKATITRNTANANGDLGIEAVPGVTDGGGNKARGNGNPAQCVGVTCK